MAQYAENIYFGKPSGLMDQMASSVGGIITIDFADSENRLSKRFLSTLRPAAIGCVSWIPAETMPILLMNMHPSRRI